ncbi:MAG: hypothetical protein M1371_06985 [Actinobacteria bacterium]|nr:hypothetical protein [Actinomycetota bacterium]
MELESYIGKPDKERLIAAFKHQPVDRVPNLDVLIEDKHVEKMLGRYAGNTLAYGGDPAKGVVDPEKVRPMFPKDYIELCNIIGQDVILFEHIWTPFRRLMPDGKKVLVSDRSVKTREDFRVLILPSQDDINRVLFYLDEYKDAVKDTNIGVGILFGCLIQTPYEFLVGMNDFMMMVYEDRDFVEEMLEVSTEYWIKLVKAIVAKGVDFLWPADDFAFKTGLFIPPKLFRDIWGSRYRRILEPAVNAGIPMIFHSDGKIDDMVGDLIDMGINCITPMDPYGIDYRDYKKRFGAKACLHGNIDIEWPLTKGTPEEVDADVKAHMDVLKPGYGYVAGCSHSLINTIPWENVVAYFNAIHKYGIY